MGVYFARHDFLVADGVSPERPRESVASVFANQGSTVNIVVRNTLDWIRGSPDSGPFTITWFTPSALVPATLRRSRETIVAASNNGGEPGNEEPDPWSASRIFLFPGEIDPAREVVQGPEAVKFAKGFKQLFNCSLLGATAFDLDTGDVYFHYSHEVPLQVACAKLWATRKFLFVDASKFRRVGTRAHSITELLKTSESVTLYTCASGGEVKSIRDRFEKLREKLIREHPELQTPFRLCVVGTNETPTQLAGC